MHTRYASESRFGARAGTLGARKRMPVTCDAEVGTPSVAKGVRTQAWNASGIGALSRDLANAIEQIRGDGDTLPLRAFRVLPAPFPREAHVRILGHHRDQRLDALEIRLLARERSRVDRKQRLADARR